MFSLSQEEQLIQTAGVLNTIAPTHLPPRLSLVPLGEEFKEQEDDFFAQYEPMDHPQGSLRLKTMQRAHRPTRLTADGWRLEARSNANRVPFHTNNPYTQMGFWSYLAYNLTDPCCGTSEWIYDDGNDYDGDMEDVDVDDNGLFWRDYNPKREVYDLQLKIQSSNLSERQRSYLEKKLEHMTRDPLAYDFDDDEEEEEETVLTMDESLAEGQMSSMEVAVRKFKKFEREQRYMEKQQQQQQYQYQYQQQGIHTKYSF